MSLSDLKIGIVGSGNVAHHLAHAFYFHPEINFNSIYTRNVKTGRVLADAVQVSFIETLDEFLDLNDLIIICASDDSIDNLCKQLKGKQQIIAHTSGVVSIEVLKQASENYGSFYPLQTFTKTREVDLKEVPFLIAASNTHSRKILEELAHLVSNKVRLVSDEKRRKLHLAAVMVNNFSNHLFALTKDYTNKLALDFDLLKPLMQETVMKALAQNPKDIQTGPAKRKDTKTIEEHLKMLENQKLQEIYLWFTESIGKYYE
jgi:predicted short-subunit dehydrogenase-like oxidoreductase (DUF2520 family)